ncbi:MAG TPA: anaerobic sulfatase maturase, partial [Candidatus Latescibacteria bacterium]|nr:anaerobic sulfatase maturase [Candidatus Latescibacterota bacterium]
MNDHLIGKFANLESSMACIPILVKPTSADCNLSCVYCFYRDRSSDPYAGVPHRIMPEPVLEAFISQYLWLCEAGTASFCWQGGEPLMAGLEFFRKVVALQIKHGRGGQRVANSVQTNGVLLDERWAEFFREYNFFIGLSIDGPKDIHDLHRRSPAGGSFRRVMRAAEVLREYGVPFNVLAVVTRRTQGEAERLYKFFLSKGFRHLQFIPCVEPDQMYTVTPEGYGEFLCELFDLWYNNGRPQASVRFFDNLLQTYLGLRPDSCSFQKKCGTYVVVEYNGDVYPCDFFVEKRWLLGNLVKTPMGEILESSKFREFSEWKIGPFSECVDCRWSWVCHNGCPRFRYVAGGTSEYLCPAYKRFFSYADAGLRALADR